ncbi:MAG TPA: hypothetical protein DEQ50_10520 [Lactobacillus sp.]|nr:hypothetical protein [Lactobacillus sp.]
MNKGYNPYEKFNQILLGITQVANIAGVTSRQLRYWEERGLIQSASKKANNARQYSVSTTLKVIIISHFNQGGMSLDEAAKIAEEISFQSQALGLLLAKGYSGFEKTDDEMKIFLEPVANNDNQKIVGIIKNEKVSFSIEDKTIEGK